MLGLYPVNKAWNFLMHSNGKVMSQPAVFLHFLSDWPCSDFFFFVVIILLLLLHLLSVLLRSDQSSPPSHKCPCLRGEWHLCGAELDRAWTQRQGAAHLLRGAGQSLHAHTGKHKRALYWNAGDIFVDSYLWQPLTWTQPPNPAASWKTLVLVFAYF